MGDLEKKDQLSIIKLIHDDKYPVPKPFQREIFLFDTYIAGTTHVEGIVEIGKTLNKEDRLEFFREPSNPYDSRAITIKTLAGMKVGYVPKADNEVFSRLMDAGKLLFARVSDKEMKGNWLKIAIKVFLKE